MGWKSSKLLLHAEGRASGSPSLADLPSVVTLGSGALLGSVEQCTQESVQIWAGLGNTFHPEAKSPAPLSGMYLHVKENVCI